MSPKKAVQELLKLGCSQTEIATLLAESGVKTTQETISRIGTGTIKNPNFELGSALVRLIEQKSKDSPKAA